MNRQTATPEREYLSVDQLAQRTPWTPAAVRRMIARGQLERGRHYFQPTGPRGQLIFSWPAIVEYIERRGEEEPTNGRVQDLAVAVDLDAIRTKAKELLG